MSPQRRVLTAVVLAAYTLPLALGALSDLAHGAQHVLEDFREREARAAALGLVHLDSPRLTHAHGGDMHSHVGGVAALLVADERADEHTEEGAPPPIELSAHAPAIVGYALTSPLAEGAVAEAVAVGAARSLAPPLLPPPRA